MIRRLVAGLALAFTIPAFAAQPIAGRWLTADGNAVVAIGPCGAALCGRIVQVLKAPSGNPDAAARARQAVGVAILTGLTPDGDGWKGRVMNPKTGKTYDARVKREGGKLKVQGCLSIFCQTMTWTAAG